MTDPAALTDEELAEEDFDRTADENLGCLNSPSASIGILRGEVSDLIAALRASRAEAESAWEKYDGAVQVIRRLQTALGRAPEGWLKGDEEAWAAYTGDSGEPPE